MLTTLFMCIIATSSCTKKDVPNKKNLFDSCRLWGFASVEGEGLATTTGGSGGARVTVSTFGELVGYAAAKEPKTILISGTIKSPDAKMISVKPNKTFIGLPGATLDGFGLNISKSANVIVSNLTFVNGKDDSITVQRGSHHVWVHHNTFYPTVDGSVDVKTGSNLVTIGWNHFINTHFTSLVGHNNDNGAEDTGKLKVTYHHNWFERSTMRHPRVRFGEVHIVNNFYDTITPKDGEGYGVASTQDAKVMVEGNYFLNTTIPTHIGYQWDKVTFSKAGWLVEHNNIFEHSGKPQTWPTNINFSDYYPYTVAPPKEVPSLVQQYSGANIQCP